MNNKLYVAPIQRLYRDPNTMFAELEDGEEVVVVGGKDAHLLIVMK